MVRANLVHWMLGDVPPHGCQRAAARDQCGRTCRTGRMRRARVQARTFRATACNRLLGGERPPWRPSLLAHTVPPLLLVARPWSAAPWHGRLVRALGQRPTRARPDAPLGCRGSDHAAEHRGARHHKRSQPPSHTVTASITYGHSLHYMRLQPPSHTVTGDGKQIYKEHNDYIDGDGEKLQGVRLLIATHNILGANLHAVRPPFFMAALTMARLTMARLTMAILTMADSLVAILTSISISSLYK